MENSGLGTLAKLPREIRDMIFDLLFLNRDCPCTGLLILNTVLPVHSSVCAHNVTASPSVEGLKRVFDEKLPPALRTKCSHRFYREYLESYLRSISIQFTGRTQDIAAITQTLCSLNTVADVASSTRKLSVGCRLRIADESSPRLCLLRQKFLIKFPEILKTLKRCNQNFGMPASRLSISVYYDDIILSIARYLPIQEYVCRQYELLRAQTDLRDCLRLPIGIVVGDRVQSIQNMERLCGVIEKLMYTCFTLTYENPTVLRNNQPQLNLGEDIEQARSMVKHVLSRVRESHLLFIDIAMQYWEDEDEEELENVCRRLRWKGKHTDNV